MTSNEFTMLHANIIQLQNLISIVAAWQPDAWKIADEFEAFSAQQLAMSVSIGASDEEREAFRTAHSELSDYLAERIQRVHGPRPRP